MRKPEATSSRSKSKTTPTVDAELRHHMIEEAAYYMAEHRGFSGGDPVQDWVVAEAEINTVLRGMSPATPEETAAYAHLREEVRKAFTQIQDVVDPAALKSAFERGMNEIKQIGSHSAESIHNAAAAVRADMAHAAERMGPTWEHFSERGAGLFSVWKHRSRDFLDRSAEAVRHWLHPEPRGPQH